MFPALERVFHVAGCRTQTELAQLLQIRQSSISDAKRRGSIPAEWLLKLLKLKGTNPDWIMTGQGPRFMQPVENLGPHAMQAVFAPQGRPLAECTAQELITELVRQALKDIRQEQTP